MAEMWEKAKEMELQGKAYYRRLAGEAATKELAGVFTRLADEEQAHYELFDLMQTGLGSSAKTAMGTAVDEAKAWFAKMSAGPIEHGTVADAERAYAKAAELERKTVAHYSELLSQASDEISKRVLQFLVSEEERHEKLMESLALLVRAPKQWVEDAEFGLRADY